MDVIQFKSLIEAGMGFNLRDPPAIEIEIVLIWLTYLPLILNPVVCFAYLGEYRTGAARMVRFIFGCKQPKGEEVEDNAGNGQHQSAVQQEEEKTQETDML